MFGYPQQIFDFRKFNIRENRRLKYFTLCAEEAIDVYFMSMENIISGYDGRGYPTVVFCEYLQEPYAIIASNLGRTKGFLAEFEDLVLNKETEKSKEFYSELPFDLYNLDFTGVCFPRKDAPFSRTLDAIVTLIQELGKQEQPKGFDIFLTFRAQRSAENKIAIKALKENIKENRKNFDWYDDICERKFGDVGELLGNSYHEFLLRALPKLIGRYGKEAGYKLQCPYTLYYPRPNIDFPEYYIISFVLSFDWAGKDREVKRAVRQRVPPYEIATNSYIEMIRNTLERDIQNVGETLFAREDYKREVMALLEAVKNP